MEHYIIKFGRTPNETKYRKEDVIELSQSVPFDSDVYCFLPLPRHGPSFVVGNPVAERHTSDEAYGSCISVRTAGRPSETPFRRPRTRGLDVSTARALMDANGTVRTPAVIHALQISTFTFLYSPSVH